MGREIRRVPVRWKHLKTVRKQLSGEDIHYRPMYQRDFDEAYKEWQADLEDWYEGYELWHKYGLYKGYDGTYEPIEQVIAEQKAYYVDNGYDRWHTLDIALMDTGEFDYEAYNGAPPRSPSPNDYMPHGNWYQLFENVSEGTPLTPPFKTKKQLVEWLANNEDFWGHRWTREQAAAMVKDEYAPSMVMQNGKVYTAEESVLLK